jgi:GNAT superfamily N-acetyltransferase
MIVREATLHDIAAMHRVRMAVRENRLSDPSLITQDDYVEHLTKLGRGWVAELDGVVAGFAAGRVTDGNIWALFVDPACERRGCGTRLHDVMVSWLFAQGLGRLWLSTEPGTRAQRFYLRRGWTPDPPHRPGEVRLSLVRRPASGATDPR